jgi:hypothetical protein
MAGLGNPRQCEDKIDSVMNESSDSLALLHLLWHSWQAHRMKPKKDDVMLTMAEKEPHKASCVPGLQSIHSRLEQEVHRPTEDAL